MASKPNYINDGDDIMSNHEYFMKEAIKLSASAMEHGNEPFGAVLVKDGEIVCTYENQIHTMINPTLHGETGLISKFCQETGITDLSEYTLYSSCEPCFMCSGALVWAKLGELYRNCVRKPIPSLPGFSRGMNGACVAKHIAV